MTGRRNRAQTPKQTLACGSMPAFCLASQKAGHFPCGKSLVPPPVPLSSVWLYYGSKKLDTENFKLQRTAMKFSANIISATVYLFEKISCLRG